MSGRVSLKFGQAPRPRAYLTVLHDGAARPHLSLWESCRINDRPLCGAPLPSGYESDDRAPKSACQACLVEASRLGAGFES